MNWGLVDGFELGSPETWECGLAAVQAASWRELATRSHLQKVRPQLSHAFKNGELMHLSTQTMPASASRVSWTSPCHALLQVFLPPGGHCTRHPHGPYRPGLSGDHPTPLPSRPAAREARIWGQTAALTPAPACRAASQGWSELARPRRPDRPGRGEQGGAGWCRTRARLAPGRAARPAEEGGTAAQWAR